MTRTTLLAVLCLTIALAAASARAGELEPPGPPAPSMKSLDDIPGSCRPRLA